MRDERRRNTSFHEAFPGETPVTLKEVAQKLDRNIVVLRRWALQNRFRHVLDTTGKPVILVPKSEIGLIAFMPKGKGSAPKPWKTRAARMAREGKITMLTEEQQVEATEMVPTRQTQDEDGSIHLHLLERPKFE